MGYEKEIQLKKMLKLNFLHHFWLWIYYQSTIGVLKIPIAKVIVVFEIPIVNDSDSIGHPCCEPFPKIYFNYIDVFGQIKDIHQDLIFTDLWISSNQRRGNVK